MKSLLKQLQQYAAVLILTLATLGAVAALAALGHVSPATAFALVMAAVTGGAVLGGTTLGNAALPNSATLPHIIVLLACIGYVVALAVVNVITNSQVTTFFTSALVGSALGYTYAASSSTPSAPKAASVEPLPGTMQSQAPPT
jgi:hypothetical protein